MRKPYAYLILLLVALISVTNSWAQLPMLKSETGKVFYAGVSLDTSGSYGGGIVSFKNNDPYVKPLTQLVKQNDMIAAGAMAEGKYYAMRSNPNTGMPTDFCTVDFKTGEVDVLGNAASMLSMTYDQKAKVMYGMGKSEMGSTLYSIDMTNGNLVELIDIPEHNLVAIVTTPSGLLYALSSNGKMYSVNPDTKVINERGNLIGNIKPDFRGQSLVYDGATLYWLAYAREGISTTPTCMLTTINEVTLEVAKVGKAAESFESGKLHLTGLCLTLPEGEIEETLTDIFYATVNEEDGFYGGGVVSFNRNNPYETLTHVSKQDYIVGAGAMAEGVYYAMCTEDWGYEPGDFCTIDLETGEATVLGKATLLYSMTYDEKNKIMYAVEQPDDQSGSIIYTVDLSNGTLTKIKEFDGLYLIAIAVDSNGTFYAMSDESKLCTLNLQEGTSQMVGETGITIDRFSNQSMAFNNNTLYWLLYGFTENKVGALFATIDKSNGKATLVKSGTFLSSIRLTGLCFPHKAEIETEENYKVTTIKTYGSDLGDIPIGQYARLQTNYYDKNNNLIRSSMKGVQGGTIVADIPSIYTVYNYNEKDQLVETYARQYGLYDGLDYAFAEPKHISTYEYDENGKLSRFYDGARKDTVIYEWQGNNLVKETLMHPSYGNDSEYYEMYQIVYSDFLGGVENCPRKVESLSSAFNNYNYEGIYTYNGQNQKTSYITTTIPEEKNRSKREWKYDNKGRLIEELAYEVNEAGEFVLSTRVVYTIDGDQTKIQTDGYQSYLVETRTTCDGTTAPTNLVVENVSTTTSPNTYSLSCDTPENINNMVWDIYRDGEKIARVSELVNGKILYTDKMLKNGIYDYFVQTVSLENEESVLNVSNPVTVKVFTELSSVSDIKYVSHRVEGSNESQKNMVTISWSASSDSYTVLGYNVFLGPSRRPANDETLITDIMAEVDFGLLVNPNNLKQNVVVETVYNIGKVKSEPVLIDLTEENSISEEQIAHLVEITDNQLFIKEENTSVELYNVNGTMVKSARNASNINIATLPSGVYFIKIGNSGKVNVVKIVKK